MTRDPGTSIMPGVGYLLDHERARRLAARVHAGGELVPGPSRAVIFLTARCNMSCDYCLSIYHQMPEWRSDEVEALLEWLASTGTLHVHWTGGEASLDKRLPALVRLSTSRGMDNSMSTNASLGPRTALALVDAGMRRFYTSLDSLDEAWFDELTQSAGHLRRVLDTSLPWSLRATRAAPST